MFGRDKKADEHGVRAPAEVVKAEQSGVGVTSGNPAFAGATEVVWNLDVKVKPEGGDPFDAHVEAKLPQYTALMVGSTVPVLFDPVDHSKVTLDMSPQGWADAAMASASQMGALAGNSALAAPIKEMIEAAMKDPVGFQKHAMEEAQKAFGAAGFTAMGAPQESGEAGMVDTLQKLADLHKQGVLTDEEFAQQKAKLLGEK
jgi:Short C-terminal domain